MSLLATSAYSSGDAWLVDYDVALERAKQEKKDVFIDFTGSDWCSLCKLLDKEVFSEPEFTRLMGNAFLLLKLDYPKDESKIDPRLIAQRKELLKRYGISAYPTALLADSMGVPYARISGYQKGGVQPYWDRVITLYRVHSSRDQILEQLSITKGEKERVDKLSKLLAVINDNRLIKTDYMQYYNELEALEKKYGGNSTETLRVQKIAAEAINETIRILFEGESGEMRPYLEKLFKEVNFSTLQKQELLFGLAGDYTHRKEHEEMFETFDQIIALDPESAWGKRSESMKKSALKAMADHKARHREQKNVKVTPRPPKEYAGGQVSSFADLLGTAYEKVNLLTTPQQRLLWVKATLNGVEGMFLLDSGSSMSHIKSTSFEKFGLVADQKGKPVKFFGAGEDSQEEYQVEVARFSIGDNTTLKDYLFYHLGEESPDFRQIYQFDGIIGIDLLQKLNAVVAPKEAFLFVLKDGAEAQLGTVAMKNPTWKPLELLEDSNTGLHLLLLDVNGHACYGVLDIGSEVTVLDKYALAAHDLTAIPSMASLSGIRGTITVLREGSIPSLYLGGKFAMENLPFIAVDQSHLPFAPHDHPVIGVIGQDVLACDDFYYDVAGKQLYLPTREDALRLEELTALPGIFEQDTGTLKDLIETSEFVARVTPVDLIIDFEGQGPAMILDIFDVLYTQGDPNKAPMRSTLYLDRKDLLYMQDVIEEQFLRSSADFIYIRNPEKGSRLIRYGALRQEQLMEILLPKKTAPSKSPLQCENMSPK